ncbi:hypothetical protein ACO0RG_001566 [Hanseniaspora osmophila]
MSLGEAEIAVTEEPAPIAAAKKSAQIAETKEATEDSEAIIPSDDTKSEEAQPQAKTETDTEKPKPASNQGFYSFFNKVDTFLSSTASQIQSSLPEETSYLNKAVKKNLFVLNQKLNDFTQSNSNFEKSKLPKTYLELEQKCDCIEKMLKKLLVVTETYRIEGYDYPPNLSEGFSELLTFGKAEKSESSMEQSTEKHIPEDTDSGKKSHFLPRSFSQALSNAFKESHSVVLSIARKNSVGHVDVDEEDESVQDLIKVFDALKDAHYEMDEVKANMDKLMSDIFNQGLKDLISKDLRKIHNSRKQVESARWDLDALRYELLDKTITEQDPEFKEKEKLEDAFVTKTTDAVSIMGEFIDSVDLLKLLKLFNEFQLDYHKKCAASLQTSLDVLNSLNLDEDHDEETEDENGVEATDA